MSEQPFDALERRRGQVETQRENTARLAKTFAFWRTKGRGEIRVDTVFPFDVTFIEKPHFTSGVELVEEGVDLVSGRFPRVTAGVWRWHTDDRGFYRGAYCFFVVDTIGPGQDYLRTDPLYELLHHLSFEGIALKDLPAYLLDF